MKLRIGIVTFHRAINYGAVLQTYALLKTLESIEPDASICVVDYTNRVIKKNDRIVFLRPICKSRFVKDIVANFTQLIRFWSGYILRLRFRKFVETYVAPESVINLDAFDLIIYGSDQIWNPIITGHDKVYFGFGYKGKKVSYAASDGGRWVHDDDAITYLRGFLHISCRERTLTEKLRLILPEMNIETVCDPVFLVDLQEWMKITVPVRDADYILVYKLSENSNIEAEALALGERLGKKVVMLDYSFSLRSVFFNGINRRIAVSPQTFVSYFLNASAVITNSFHGAVFSIVFRKPFASLQLDMGGERITDLLTTIGLESRWVQSVENLSFDGKLYDSDVERRIYEYRDHSLQYLRNCLID